MPVDLKIDNKQVMISLSGAESAVSDLTPAMKVIGEDLRNSIRENFAKQGRPNKWVTWSAEYGAWRRKKRPGKILTLTRRLANSFTIDVTANDVVVGTNVVYAATHNYGDKKRGIPQREFMLIQPADEEEMLDTISDYIQGKIDGRF